ncbi:MAG: VWA domain-containing protein [Thermoanaerobaculia bacterium]
MVRREFSVTLPLEGGPLGGRHPQPLASGHFAMKSACWLFALLTLAPAAQAAKPTPPAKAPAAPDPGYVETVNVSVVNVEVYVTDKQGKRVTGLTKDDFEILENGRPVALSNFWPVANGRVTAAADPPPPPPEPPALEPGAPPGTPLPKAVEAPIPDEQRLYLVVYIDNFNLQPFNRNRVLRELRDFLRNRFGPEDRLMLVTYDRELHVRRSWTSDNKLVAAMLQELETVTGSAVHRESDRRSALEQIEDADSADSATAIVRSYAQSINNDLNFSVDALRDVVNGLAGLPGRKAILYVSEGLPQIPGQDLFYAVQAKFGDTSVLTQSFEFDASRRFSELAASANANRITFYTIDAGGLRTLGYGDASRQTAGQTGFVEQTYTANLQGPLITMASDTGGRSVINANKVAKDLTAIADDFDNYYSLGYMPSHFGDGRYYKIEVKLKNKKGMTVRHREGYRDKPASVRMEEGTLAALAYRFESNNAGIKIDFGSATPRDDGTFMVPVKLSIPLGKIVLVPTPDKSEARLKVYVAAMDSDGHTSDVQESPLGLGIPQNEVEKARQQLYLYTVNLLMRGGPQRVAVGLLDEVSGETSFVTGTVVVGQGGP